MARRIKRSRQRLLGVENQLPPAEDRRLSRGAFTNLNQRETKSS